VYPWLEGESATPERLGDAGRAAADLARFVAALQALDATDGPRPGAHNFHRGVPLALRDPYTREAIGKLHGVLDTGAATAAWEAALRARPWDGPPVWLHGDLQSGNLLAASGRLRAVIDFGGLGVGDPACDAMAAWTFLPRATRSVFRAALRVDDATWERARGWALSVGLVALAYYQRSNPVLAGISRRAIEEVLADHASAA
jgi:aminoglycoside phosphotransferase (APT) family kinase protein